MKIPNLPKIEMTKRMKVMLLCVGILFGSIFGYHAFSKIMMKIFFSSQHQLITVSAMKVHYSDWQPQIKASGSVRAIKGVNVTTELSGMVQSISFTPGAHVEQGMVLVQLNANSDIAQLHALEASAELASITYKRDKAQYAIKAISKQALDADAANLKNLEAQVAQQTANVAKKTIKAPFTGRLGISAVNPGQYLNTGDKVVSLQSLDPIYVDFYLPQQALARLKTGLPVLITTDAYPGEVFNGTLTTIDSAVDANTRNVEVEATITNSLYKLTPGMFTYVEIKTGTAQRYLTLPQTAISFNPYGEIVYILKPTKKKKKGSPIFIANQSFVTTGETRGDQITVLQGLKEGDTVVTSGQLKLKNGSEVVINNTVVPANTATPSVPNEH